MKYSYRITATDGESVTSDDANLLRAFALEHSDGRNHHMVIALIEEVCADATWDKLTARLERTTGVKIERFPVIRLETLPNNTL